MHNEGAMQALRQPPSVQGPPQQQAPPQVGPPGAPPPGAPGGLHPQQLAQMQQQVAALRGGGGMV